MDNRLIEHVGPEQARYFTPITVIKLAYTRKSLIPLFPENEDPEVQVWLRIGEEEKSVVVPSRVIDDERGIIIGTMRTYLQSANRVTVGFPRTNWKTARISADQRHRQVHVISNDTLVESPIIIQHLKNSLTDIQEAATRDGIPLTTHISEPCTDQTFWVNVIGRGYMPPLATSAGAPTE